MNITETKFRKLLHEGLVSLGIELETDATERLYSYFVELKKWSRKVNLIAKSTGDEKIIENHFLDSLTLLPLLEGDVHLLDVGTGAGFPGLVLKAARPEIRVTLVEPRLKRVSFLRHVARTLGLNDVQVFAARIEDEKVLPSVNDFTHVTSRAVTEIGEFLQMVSRFKKPGLQVICMKGPKWKEELDNAASVVRDLRFVHQGQLVKALPFGGAERVLVTFLAETKG